MTSVPGAVEDLSKIETHEVEFQGDDAAIRAYTARRGVGAEPAAAMLVIHEAFGLNDHIRDLARRFANLGYLVLAPDLYTRTGGVNSGNMDAVLHAMFSLPDAQIVGDLQGACSYLRSRGRITKVGCIGFCSGGRQTLLGAFSGVDFDVVVDCWGGYVRRATPTDITTAARPTPVLDLCDNLQCPMFAAFGAEDQNPSPDDAATLKGRLKGKEAIIKIYDGAGHAFLADYRPTYREGPAHRLWADVNDFLTPHLLQRHDNAV